MRKVLSILKNEVLSLISRFSFWFGVLGVPLIAFVILSVVQSINRSQENAQTPSPIAGVANLFSSRDDQRPQGYLDQAGLLKAVPPQLDRRLWVQYTSEQQAKTDLDADKINAYYILPADYRQSGKLYVYARDYNPATSDERTEGLKTLIQYNLLGGDDALTRAVNNPIIQQEDIDLSPEPTNRVSDKNSMLAFFLPYGVMMIFFITILGSSTMLLNSIAKEKENRVLEVLMLSTTPHQLLMGKIIGLGLVGLLQVVIWFGSALFLFRLSGQTFESVSAVQLPPSLFAWGVLYYLLGYLVYSSLMAGVGALVPKVREASQATFVLMLPMMTPLFLLSALIEAPNGPLSVALSLFPFTASTTMMMRLSAAHVPTWQVILSIFLLIATAVVTIRSVARMFRAQTLLSGQPFSLKRFALALAGRG